jgi:hypothetical protein
MKATFDREVWKLTMDWLCTGEHGLPEDPEKRARIASAAQRDADVAQVDAWRVQAQPIPDWALKVDRATPHWGVEICNDAWPVYLEAQLRKISEGLWWPSVGWCGGSPLTRQQWGAWAVDALSDWLDSGAPDGHNPLTAEIAALLGEHNPDKVGAVRLLKATLELGITKPPRQFDAHFEKLEATSPLAKAMRPKIKYLQFRCGYRWEQIVRETCRAIGDEAYRQGEPRFWHVGSCNGQIAFAHRDDPLRIPTTAGILIGLWAWLRAVPADDAVAAYPEFAALAARVRQQLGERTPVKRWLAGRLFVGVRIWLQAYDHGDLAPPHPALETYPTLHALHYDTAIL